MSGLGRARAWRWIFACGAGLALGVAAPAARAAEPDPVRLLGSGSGRFEVVAEPGPDGLRLAELALAAWSEWSGPLGLPARLPMAITVRLIPEARWAFGAEDARVAVEQSGVVTVWIRAGGTAGLERERRWLAALAEGALRRKALLLGVEPAKAKAPAWLSAAAAEAMVVAERPAMLDAWQTEEGRGERAADLREVLLWVDRSPGEATEARRRAAFGVWLWLREESARSGAWERLLVSIVRGESPGAALAREFSRLAERPSEAREWELAWQVGRARLIGARVTPMMSAAESRAWIERVARVVALETSSGEERVMPVWGEWASREQTWLRVERAERTRLLAANLNRLHPFYRNAAGSLGRVWTAWAEGREAAWRQASIEWTQDWEAGRMLEDASRRLLDEATGN